MGSLHAHERRVTGDKEIDKAREIDRLEKSECDRTGKAKSTES